MTRGPPGRARSRCKPQPRDYSRVIVSAAHLPLRLRIRRRSFPARLCSVSDRASIIQQSKSCLDESLHALLPARVFLARRSRGRDASVIHVNTFCFGEIILEKHKMAERADRPKPNQLRAAHGHICRPYVTSLGRIYRSSVACLDPLKPQAGRGNVRMATVRHHSLVPEGGNGTFVFVCSPELGSSRVGHSW